ncbi:filamentous hemagglutinin N-terminal domain-containing protein [Desulfobacterales bacterium HSG16]|nr:filamentous hemagglutinin N-terminal domain-containing protein [Desulfobacterales bacterium HSG16]
MKRGIIRYISLFVSIIVTATPIYADVVTDGTMGAAASLPGPDYNISPNLGKQAGGNLFHSFKNFNIHNGENATFSGPTSIRNIISRVTGGDSSWIDGKLRSTIQGADLYLMNPAGVMFGPNASLDLSGSFHVTTADYLRLGENAAFYAYPLENEVLSVSSPTAFGFLDNDAAPISFEGRGNIREQEWLDNPTGLHVDTGKTISLIGGNIDIKKGTSYQTLEIDENGNPVVDDDGSLVMETKTPGEIKAPEGRIDIVAVAFPGEVVPRESGLNISSEKMENISISEKVLIDVGGGGGGSVFISGGRIVVNDSIIRAVTLNDKDGKEVKIFGNNVSFVEGAWIDCSTEGKGDGGNITIHSDELFRLSGVNNEGRSSQIRLRTTNQGDDAGDSGTLFIKSEDALFEGGTWIDGRTYGNGNVSNIELHAKNKLSFTGQTEAGWPSAIYANIREESNGGNGGKVFIEANEILLSDGAKFTTTSFGHGRAGKLTVIAKEKITLEGATIQGWAGGFFSGSNPKIDFGGEGGEISVKAGELIIKNGAFISSNSVAPEGKESSDAGVIAIEVSGKTLLSGVNPYGENEDGFGSGIYARSKGEGINAGDAGKIVLETGTLAIENGAVISSSTNNSARGGNIIIQVNDSIDLSGKGDKSDVRFESGQSQENFLKDFSQEVYNQSNSGIYASSESTENNGGPSGSISLSAKLLSISDGGKISTSSSGGGDSGDIKLSVNKLCLEKEGSISSASNSTKNVAGRAGRIIIDALDSVKLLNGSAMTTEAKGAGGGKITINVGDSTYLYNSKITSSVRQGEGSGGDIRAKSAFVILNHSNIEANAEEGDGGAVFISTDNFIKSVNSQVTATSKRGNEGTVEIEAPELDMASSLTAMPSSFVDSAQWLKTPCAQRTGQKVSRFVMPGRDGIPTSHDDLLSAKTFWLDDIDADDNPKRRGHVDLSGLKEFSNDTLDSCKECK